jgi:hypothetical protein
MDYKYKRIRNRTCQERIVDRELLIFRWYQLDVKDIIKCSFQWLKKHETMFPIVGFLACHILGIVGS